MSTRCTVCGGALGAVLRPASDVRRGPVAAAVEAHHRQHCSACGGAGDDRALTTAVLGALDERLLVGAGRPTAARCGSCDAALELPMRATTRAMTVAPSDGAPFTVTLALPLVRCGSCAVDNVPPELGDDVRRVCLEACGVGTPDAGGWLRRLRRRAGRGSPGRPSRP